MIGVKCREETYKMKCNKRVKKQRHIFIVSTNKT